MRQELAKTTGQVIARWRITHQMTQEELAMAIDVDPMTVSRFERGVTLPSLVTLQQIATVFGVTMAQMLEEVPSAPASSAPNVFSLLMKNLAPEEQEFFLETIRRYRALNQQRKKSSN